MEIDDGTRYRIRQQIITELAASGGLTGPDRVATEVLFYLPPSFLAAYEQLFWSAFKPQGSAPIGTRGGGLLQRGEGLQAAGGGKKYKEYWVIISDKAYRRKLRLDQKLGDIAVDLERAVSGNDHVGGKTLQGGGMGGAKRCGGCKKFLEGSYNFCPGCGRKVDSEKR